MDREARQRCKSNSWNVRFRSKMFRLLTLRRSRRNWRTRKTSLEGIQPINSFIILVSFITKLKLGLLSKNMGPLQVQKFNQQIRGQGTSINHSRRWVDETNWIWSIEAVKQEEWWMGQLWARAMRTSSFPNSKSSASSTPTSSRLRQERPNSITKSGSRTPLQPWAWACNRTETTVHSSTTWLKSKHKTVQSRTKDGSS